MRPSSAMALPSVDGRPPEPRCLRRPRSERIISEALTVSSFKEPATRSISFQFSAMSSVSTVLRAMLSSKP